VLQLLQVHRWTDEMVTAKRSAYYLLQRDVVVDFYMRAAQGGQTHHCEHLVSGERAVQVPRGLHQLPKGRLT